MPRCAWRISSPVLIRRKRRELVEKAGAQEGRTARPSRPAGVTCAARLLRNVVREYPDSEAGKSRRPESHADTITEAAGQRIRMTRGFLYENPAVAAVRHGLGIRLGISGRGSRQRRTPSGRRDLPGRKPRRVCLRGCSAVTKTLAPVPIRRKVSRANASVQCGRRARRNFAFHNARMDEGASRWAGCPARHFLRTGSARTHPDTTDLTAQRPVDLCLPEPSRALRHGTRPRFHPPLRPGSSGFRRRPVARRLSALA